MTKQAQQQQAKKKSKNKNGIEFSDKQVVTHLFRIAFPNLIEKASFKGGLPSFNFMMLFPHETDFSQPVSNKPGKDGKPRISLLKAIYNAKVEMWGEKKHWPSPIETPIKDGDDKPTWEGFEGHFYIKAKSYNPIKVFGTTPNPNGKGFLPIDPGLIEGGDYCRATISASSYDDPDCGVNFYCSSIQLVKKGEPFGDTASGEDYDDGVYEDQYESPEIEEPEESDEPEEDSYEDVPRRRQGASARPDKPSKFSYGANELKQRSNRKAHSPNESVFRDKYGRVIDIDAVEF